MSLEPNVDWDQFCNNPSDYEHLVKLLLQRLHDDGQAIDGAGGDGGREFQVRTPDSLTLYEAKSFRGRLGTAQKRRDQVERSLVSAARHQPDAWNLVVPIDPNPAEQRWFDTLRAGDYPFIHQWLGITWLEQQLAQHDDLVRFVTENKLLTYIRTYKVEQEALAGGTRDLVERFDALEQLADTLSPDWRPVVGRLADGTRVVELQAKHPDAAEDAPITFRFAANIPDRPDTADLLAALKLNRELGAGTVEIPGYFLSDLVVDGPAGLGLPGANAVLDRVVIMETPETAQLPLQHLAVYGPGAAFPLATLTFRTEKRTHGRVGWRLTAWDLARTVRLTTDLRGLAAKINLTAAPHTAILPSALLPGLRLAHALHAPNTMVLTVQDANQSSRTEVPIDNVVGENVPDDLICFIEDLAVIQDRLRQPFAVPDEISRADMGRAHRLRRLIDGETVPWVHGTITVTLHPDKIASFKGQFPSGGEQLRITWDDETVRIGEIEVHTGPMYMTGVVAIDLDAVPDTAPPGEEVTATFRLVDDQEFQARLGLPPDEPIDQSSHAAPQGAGRVAYQANPG